VAHVGTVHGPSWLDMVDSKARRRGLSRKMMVLGCCLLRQSMMARSEVDFSDAMLSFVHLSSHVGEARHCFDA